MNERHAPGKAGLRRAVRGAFAAAGVGALLAAAVVPLSLIQQIAFAACTVVLAIVAEKASASRTVTLFLVLLSVFSSIRYGIWRLIGVAVFFHAGPAHGWVLDRAVVLVLLGSEAYCLLGLALGYFQTLAPLRRAPAPLPQDPDLWPEVDLLIPTLNEPLQVVKYTALAATYIDWPADRLNVYILDDGRREEVRSFCAEAGIGYLVRDNLRHAKAGNVNEALRRLSAPFVAIFDADQVPTRSFLQVTMGWLLHDPGLALVQTPQQTYSPDPFERNLDQFRVVPSEGELFYGVVQDGNDLWNATYFCGSCAVLRRAALDDVGGMAVGTLTEDAHTSVRLQKKGWSTAYINLPQAAGLAPDRLSSHVRQRIRWARGMVQVMRKENPLLARGLTWPQRFCYFHAMVHFFYALPRLIFLVAPLWLLVFGGTTIPASWLELLAYVGPHLLLFYLTTARIQGRHRYSFWNEIYETVLSPYILLPTLAGLFSREEGRFNVTPKAGVVARAFFDSRVGWPFVVLFFANLLGVLFACLRLSPHARFYLHLPLANPLHMGQVPAGTIWINLVWTLFNLLILSVAIGVARESRQRRSTVRVSISVPGHVLLQDGSLREGQTVDISAGGALFVAREGVHVRYGEPATLILPTLHGQAKFPVTVVSTWEGEVRLEFEKLTLRDEELLTTILYSRADTWARLQGARERDHPLRSLRRILSLGAHGIGAVLATGWSRGRESESVLGGGFSALMAAVLLLGSLVPHALRAQDVRENDVQATGSLQNRAAGERVNILLDSLTGDSSLVLSGSHPSTVVAFVLPDTEVVQTAALHLGYKLSAGKSFRGILAIDLNGVQVGQFGLAGGVDGQGSQMQSVLLPPELLVHKDTLTVRLLKISQNACDPQGCAGVEVSVDPGSALQIVQEPLSARGTRRVPSLGSNRNSNRDYLRRFRRVNGRHLLRAVVRAFSVQLWRILLLMIGVPAVCIVLAQLLERHLRSRSRGRLEDPWSLG